MSEDSKAGTSRRQFLSNTGRVAGASALAGVALPHVHAAENNTIQLALIGCGGRGTGAAENALTVKNGPIKLVAMADVFPAKLSASYDKLKTKFSDQIDVPESRRFLGFDAYTKALDTLKKGDVAILATPPAFRWVHFKQAIDRGLNVFMEKPVTVDGPTTRRMFQLGELAGQKNLKVAVGLMVRHCRARQALADRIRSGQIGDIIAMRAYRMSGAGGFTGPRPPELPEVMFQIQKFHSFLWASGGLFSDFYIHNIDECCMMKDAWPVKAEALGGRHYRGGDVDQNFDTYDVEYTFPDGSKLFFMGRCINGCANQFASYAHGTKGCAQISLNGHSPTHAKIWRGQDMTAAPKWMFPQPEPNPYQLEWDHLMESIRKDRPHNEVRRGAEASLITSMGRMAAHTGQVVTRDQMLACAHEFAPNVDKLTMDGPPPLLADADGKYPVPQPGIKKTREY